MSALVLVVVVLAGLVMMLVATAQRPPRLPSGSSTPVVVWARLLNSCPTFYGAMHPGRVTWLRVCLGSMAIGAPAALYA